MTLQKPGKREREREIKLWLDLDQVIDNHIIIGIQVVWKFVLKTMTMICHSILVRYKHTYLQTYGSCIDSHDGWSATN